MCATNYKKKVQKKSVINCFITSSIDDGHPMYYLGGHGRTC